MKPDKNENQAKDAGHLTMTVIMPSLNEEWNIEAAVHATLGAFDRFGIAGEVIVVDDGGSDGTGARVRAMMAAEPRVRMLRHETPRGVGASFWDGVVQARGEFACYLPGDNENFPEEILRYHALLEHVDFLVPFILNKSVRTPFRKFLSFAFRSIINATFGVHFNYTNGTIVCRRTALDEIKYRSTSLFFTADIAVRLSRRGYLFAEVPCWLRPRRPGPSKIPSLRLFGVVVREYLHLMRDIYFGAPDTSALARDSAAARRGSETAPDAGQ